MGLGEGGCADFIVGPEHLPFTEQGEPNVVMVPIFSHCNDKVVPGARHFPYLMDLS